MSVNINGSTGVSLVQDGVIVTADMASSVPLGAKNRIINGNMAIDQRNAGAAVVVGGSITYVVDRFLLANTTGTGTTTGQQSTLGNAKSFKLTATAAVTALTTSLTVYGIAHRIEAQNIFDLNSKGITISFNVETNWSGNLSIAIANYNFSRSYISDIAVVSGTNNVNLSLTLEATSVLTNDNTQGLQIAIGANNEATYRTATTDTWIAGFFNCSTSSTQWAKTTGNFINVTNVQLEEGSTATAFEHRSYGQELALCQRYYYQIGGNSVVGTGAYTIIGVGQALNTSTVDMAVPFKVSMMAAPTLVYSGIL